MRRPIIIICSLFILSFIYLHQKISLSIEAYRLSSNWKVYNELVAKRDALLYNFCEQVPLDKLNLWAESNSLKLAKKENILALDVREEEFPREKLTKGGFFVPKNLRLFVFPGAQRALAEDKETP